VDLNARIQEYVSDFPEKRYPLTLRQVAQHVGGIRHYRGMEYMSNLHFTTIRDGLEIFMHDTLLFEPGSQYAYSSYGWNLVSAAMETAADQEFLSYMEEQVFKPLKMKHTYADDNTVLLENRVTFYMQRDSQNIVAPMVDNSYKWAGGGFLSTAEDLIRFGQAILDRGFLSEESLDISWTGYELTDGTETKYGIGWYWDEDAQGRRWIGHGGGSVGGSSMFLTYPEEELIVVMLVNLSRAKSEGLPFRIAEAFLAQQ
jgi:serine beta-lactamase-like protein LACTB